MNERFTAWFPLLVLVILAALTFWLNQKVRLPDPAQDGSRRHDPDFIVDGLSAVQMNQNGEARYSLIAKRMVHYPDDDSTHLENPRLLHTEKNRAPITVVAKRALLSRDGQHAYFRDNVRLVRAPYDNRSELSLLTNFLHVIPDQDIAKTDKPVTIKDADTTIKAVGMEFNNATRIINLLSKVNGHYVQPQR